jgi:hypothetical protein
MESLCSRLSKFQTDNGTWNLYDFYDIQNKEMKHSVLNILKAESGFVDSLLEKGSYSEADDFYKKIQETASHMGMITFSCLLEQLFLREELDKPFSREMVSWYRKNGWKFPDFSFECERLLVNEINKIGKDKSD